MGSEFSPRFEEHVQRNERLSKSTRRQRVRVQECVIPECHNPVRRSNSYPLCVEHLIRIWKLVEGDNVLLPGKGQHLGLPDEPIKAVTTLTVEEQEARALAKRAKLREAAASTGWLYALDTRDGLVKIGWTGRDLWERMAQYPPTFRLIVSIRGSRADERDAHRSLKLSLRRGREWYEPTSEVVRQINSWIVIANTVAAQVAADRRAKAKAQWDEGMPRAPWLEPLMKTQPQLLPRFTTLEEFASRHPALKATGTEPEGYFRA